MQQSIISLSLCLCLYYKDYIKRLYVMSRLLRQTEHLASLKSSAVQKDKKESEGFSVISYYS